jgi:hypothetical protein
MGTTLTGTTPQDTYDSLIKVTDNGPLSGTAKYLSDGLGNDSALALSNARVGIGTSSPSTQLTTTGTFHFGNSVTGNVGSFGQVTATADTYFRINNTAGNFDVGTSANEHYLYGIGALPLKMFTNATERLRVLSDGGLTFNGDSAQANALDDYEEGTFTATLKGSVSDPTTPVTTTGTYTKIGRQVTVNVIFSGVDTTGANGDVSITGMPFTASGTSNGSVSCFQFTFPSNTSLASYIGATSTTVEILISGTNANWGALSHSAGGSRFLWTTITYFV